MEYFLGLDFGTSAVKAIVIDAKMTIHAQVSQGLAAPIKIELEQGIGIEQDPLIWWAAFLGLIEKLKQEINIAQIKAIAIDGTSGTVLVCNKQGQVLSPALMYNDSRTYEQSQQIKQLCSRLKIKNGNLSALARLLFLLEKNKQKEISHILHQADWILGKLANNFAYSDINNVLKMAYDPISKAWPDWFKELEIPPNILPKVFRPGEYIQTIDKQYTGLGFSADTCLIAGSTDSTAAIIASGAELPGQAITSLGSTMVMKIISETAINDAANGVYSQPYGQYWLVGGSSNSGGAVLKHYFSQEQIEQYSQLLDADKNTGLNYYPLIHPGERFPFADPEKLPKLSPRPSDNQRFFQGILEGMANIEYQAYKKLQQLGAPFPTSVISMGGGTQNIGWKKIREQKLGIPMITAKIDQAAFGMAKLAWHGYIYITR